MNGCGILLALIMLSNLYSKALFALCHEIQNLTEQYITRDACDIFPSCRQYCKRWLFLVEPARRHIYLPDLWRKRLGLEAAEKKTV
jgi:hypothetical protein